jgi:hypothetical protein
MQTLREVKNRNRSFTMNFKILGLLIIVLLPSGLTQAQRRSDRDGFRQQYKLILDRNIFSRDRRPYVPRERKTTYRPPPPIETDYCLKGIAREREQLTAFIEQISTGVIDRYFLNAKIAKGSIQTITLDMVEYAVDAAVVTKDLTEPNAASDPNDLNALNSSSDPNDPNDSSTSIDPNDSKDIKGPEGIKVTQVRIGQTLQGLAPGTTASLDRGRGDGSVSAGTTSSPSETPADAAPMGDDESEILKRLMQRRQQELGN